MKEATLQNNRIYIRSFFIY